MQLQPAEVILLLGCAVASVTDLRTGKIPNWLTGSLFALGLVVNAVEGAPLAGVYGTLLGFAVHFPLWVLRVEKGGDAKLVIAAGALLGWRGVIEVTLWYAAVYLPVGLLVLAWRGRLGNLKTLAKREAQKAAQLAPTEDAPAPTMLRTGPIIAVAAVGAVFTAWLDLA